MLVGSVEEMAALSSAACVAAAFSVVPTTNTSTNAAASAAAAAAAAAGRSINSGREYGRERSAALKPQRLASLSTPYPMEWLFSASFQFKSDRFHVFIIFVFFSCISFVSHRWRA